MRHLLMRLWNDERGFWQLALPYIAMGLGALFGRRGEPKTSQTDLNALMPDINPLLQYQRSRLTMTDPYAAAQFGISPAPGAVPLQAAIARLAMGLMPNYARSGLPPVAQPVVPSSFGRGRGRPQFFGPDAEA